MANDTVVRVTADATGYSAGMDKAKRSVESFLLAQETAAQRTKVAQAAIAESVTNGANASARSVNQFVAQLSRMADAVGKTRAELLEQKAAQMGITASVSAYIDKIKASEASTKSFGGATKETAFALRMLPAQFTDIATQLASGQSPFMILMQQGGQIKDMFGGIGPALRAVGGYVAGLVNPFTLSAAAIAVVGIAYAKGAAEAQAFNAALITTGNAIGVNVDGLQTLARNVGAATTGQHEAAEVINQFVKAGKVSAENLGDYAKAAIQWSQATGESTQSVVDNFTKLADDPLKALVKLDEQMHFLTATEYEHAKALDDVGDKTEAASYSQKLYANALADRTPKMVENLGLVERAWKAIKGETNQAISALMSIGRAQDLFAKLTDAQLRLKTVTDSVNRFTGPTKAQSNAIAAQQTVVAGLQDQIRLEGISGRQQAGAVQLRIQQTEAAERWGKQQEQIQSNAVKRANEIAQARRDALVLGKSEKELAEQIAAINEKYKDPKVAAVKNDGATRLLMTLREREASLRAQADDTEKLTSDQKTLAEWEQKFADLKNKKVLTADEKSYLLREQDLRLQLQRNVAAEREAEQKKALIALGQRSAQIDQQMASAREAAADQYQKLLDSFGLGDKAMQQVQAQRSIYREFQKHQDDLTKQAAKGGTLGSDAYKEETAKIQEELQRRLAMQKDYYDTVDQLRSSWTLGASHGLANYADEAANAFKGMESLATKSFQGMEDAWVDFAMTGKASFSDLANSVISDLMRIAIRQQVLGPLAGALGSTLSGMFGGPITDAQATNLMVNNVDPRLFDVGGYTGSGGKYEPAGIVHKGEGVLNADEIRSIGGEAGFNALRQAIRGPRHALGGMGGSPAYPALLPMSSGVGAAPNVAINLINQGGNQMQATQKGQPRFDGRQWVLDVMLSDLQRNGPYVRQLRGAR